jgi:hypothetical protein
MRLFVTLTAQFLGTTCFRGAAGEDRFCADDFAFVFANSDFCIPSIGRLDTFFPKSALSDFTKFLTYSTIFSVLLKRRESTRFSATSKTIFLSGLIRVRTY